MPSEFQKQQQAAKTDWKLVIITVVMFGYVVYLAAGQLGK